MELEKMNIKELSAVLNEKILVKRQLIDLELETPLPLFAYFHKRKKRKLEIKIKELEDEYCKIEEMLSDEEESADDDYDEDEDGEEEDDDDNSQVDQKQLKEEGRPITFEEKENIDYRQNNSCSFYYTDDGSITGTITYADGTIIKFIKKKGEPFAKILARKETWGRMFDRLNPLSKMNKDKTWKEYWETAMKKDKSEDGK